MTIHASYKRTKLGCYLGIFLQAIICTIMPLLFIPLMDIYGFSYTQLGILVGVNFSAQVAVDIIFSGVIDKCGYRKLALPAIVCGLAGLLLFAGSPILFPGHVYAGIVLATIVFAASSGLLEVLVSPIVDAIPSDDKGASMSLMHSAFAWGEVITIIVTTLFVFFLGGENWQIIVLLWCVVPISCFFVFWFAPFPPTIAAEHRDKPGKLLFAPFFLIALAAIFFGAASELVMSQWSSAYMERALTLPKVAGDLLGMCGFAVMMGIGRTFYGVRGAKLNMGRALLLCSAIAAVCYLTVAISPWNGLNVLACAVCGLGASLLWPGTLVVCSTRFPMAGAWMFAILAAAGDIGGAFGPWLTGILVDNTQGTALADWIMRVFAATPEQAGMRIGLFFSALFPIGAFLCHAVLRKLLRKHREEETA